MTYFDLTPIGEESLNKFLRPDLDPDHIRGVPSHGDNNYCIKNKVDRSKFLNYTCIWIVGQADRETDPNALTSHSFP